MTNWMSKLLCEIGSCADQINDAIAVIFRTFNCSLEDIQDVRVLKKGMTNRSFVFSVFGKRYIMRIPGEGTDQLINRSQEAKVFLAIRGQGFCDDPLYIDPASGYKITAYLPDVRVCDPESIDDLEKCMGKLRDFHAKQLKVDHIFDIFKQIDFYESLWNGEPSVYEDYLQTKQLVMSLAGFITQQPKKWCLTHIDAVPDNFLFYTDAEGRQSIQLTDWEYAGMQDPHVDIAMFCIYSMYDKTQIDRLIRIYFQGECDTAITAKIYAYVAACGLLWSNWCEYKRQLGVEFGEYTLRQYLYAKEYYHYAKTLIDSLSAK